MALMRFSLILILVSLTACSKSENLSSMILNQMKCATLSGDRVLIKEGEIRLSLNNEVIGKIISLDDSTIKLIDSNDQSQDMKLKISTLNDKRLLHTITDDGKQIYLACGLD